MSHSAKVCSSLWKRGFVFLCFAACVSIAGCVTTQTGGFSAEASEEKEIERRVQLASSYMHSGQITDAKKHLKRALELDPDSAAVHNSLGLAFQLSGEFELAEQHFRKSISLDSSYSRGRNNYAAFLYERERYEEAMAQFEEVVEDTLYDKRANAFSSLGNCLLKLNKPEQAKASFSRALLLDRNHAVSMLELAELYFTEGNYVESQRLYDKYRGVIKQQNARSLWLGLRLARIFADQNAEASYALALKNLYPTSQQYLDYKNSLNNKQNLGDH